MDILCGNMDFPSFDSIKSIMAAWGVTAHFSELILKATIILKNFKFNYLSKLFGYSLNFRFEF